MNTWGMDIKDVLSRVEEFGFKQVLDVPFMNDDNTTQEHLYVYFHYQYGILLEFDTYGGNGVNGGNYYYQWSPTLFHPCFSSGGWVNVKETPLWEGHGDCRSGMFESITQLAHDGRFVTPWIEASRIFVPTLVHYMDHFRTGTWDEGYELYRKALKEITPERFKMLPLLVQSAIGQNMRTQQDEE